MSQEEKREEDSQVLMVCINVKTRGDEKCTKKIKERRITETSNSNVNIKRNSKTTKSRKQKREEKQLYGYFKRQTLEDCTRDDLDMAKKWKP